MTGTAFQQIQQLLETAREEARAEGYSLGYKAGFSEGHTKAMQEVRDFTLGATSGATVFITPPETVAKDIEHSESDSPQSGRTLRPRGENRKEVEDAFRAMAPSKRSAKDIIQHLSERGLFLAYSSVRHAIGQLVERGVLVEVDPGKSWMLAPSAMMTPSEAAE